MGELAKRIDIIRLKARRKGRGGRWEGGGLFHNLGKKGGGYTTTIWEHFLCSYHCTYPQEVSSWWLCWLSCDLNNWMFWQCLCLSPLVYCSKNQPSPPRLNWCVSFHWRENCWIGNSLYAALRHMWALFSEDLITITAVKSSCCEHCVQLFDVVQWRHFTKNSPVFSDGSWTSQHFTKTATFFEGCC